MSTVPNEYIAYFPELSPTALQQFVSNRPQAEVIQAIRLFLVHYKQYPCLSNCPRPQLSSLYHVTSILNYLKDQFGCDTKNDITVRKYHVRSKQFYVRYVYNQKNNSFK